ncbi:unnamed protein product [Trichogramma brassicae]|uniref:Uncharacterized protein n=1 Tax=Trichogramma brassicae TaxID=86971 RepID=A0A6H5INX3_9HYME|nr:unnamed protein product [Trichogramma brassicae]
MPLHQGFQNCLTMIDRYTRWPQAIPIGDMSAQTNSQSGPEVLARDTVDSRTSRRPPRPTNYLQRGPASVASGDGFRHVATHTRGVRRTTRTGQNVAVRVRFGSTALCFKQLDQCQRLGMFSIARSSSRTWQRATTCFVGSTPILKPLEQPYTGPHRVIRRINERNFVVDVNGVAKTLSTDQLKPAYLDVADSGASQATPEQPTTTQPSSTRRVTFSLPAQTAQSIRGGVAVAPQSSPPNTRRSRRQLGPRAQRARPLRARRGFVRPRKRGFFKVYINAIAIQRAIQREVKMSTVTIATLDRRGAAAAHRRYDTHKI